MRKTGDVVYCCKCSKPIYKPKNQLERGMKRHYCSTACRRNGEINPCAVCKKPVYATKHKLSVGAGKFCSIKCHNKAMMQYKQCPQCHKSFNAHSRSTYCSNKCSGLAKRGRKFPDIPCKVCGKAIAWNRVFCSNHCAHRPKSEWRFVKGQSWWYGLFVGVINEEETV